MANDVIYYTALAKELKDSILGAKIDKVCQPDGDELVLNLRGNSSEMLLMCFKPNASRVVITKKKRENPMTAPAFCMLLRKRLGGGKITDVRMLNCDRILLFEIENKNELKDDTVCYLIAELMGMYSNLLLTKHDFTIIDALKRVPLGAASTRYIMPNLPYTLQPHRKIRLDETEKLQGLNWGEDEKAVVGAVSGLSKETAKEIIQLGKKSSPFTVFSELYTRATAGDISPTVILKNGKPAELLPFSYETASGDKKSFDTISEATEFYYENRIENGSQDDKTKELKKAAAKLATKLDKKRLECIERSENYSEIAKLKLFGELIYNNFYKAKGGESILVCDDFENTCTVNVPLDPTKNATENAEMYFKKYRKLKRAKEVSEEQLVGITSQREYLDEIIGSLSTVTTNKEIAEASEELKLLSGKGRTLAQKSKKQTPSTPLKLNFEGYVIYVGKNNLQNEEVTFHLADKADMWLHAKDYHGSHVIIKADGKQIPETILLRAAELAAYYSGGRTAPKVEVNYTFKKYVKHRGSSPGLVNYTDYKSLLVAPKL